jgi:alkyl sulfatase BDS1-like metallo-beta-lactamase superfamily hydrolase
MPDLLALSSRIIDEGIYEGPNAVNRMTTELSEVTPGVALIEAFSNVIGFETADGLVLFDTSLDAFGPAIQKSLRGWRAEPIHTIAYTHGHIDHVGGAGVFVEEARSAGRRRPQFVAHEAVPARFARYAATDGYNATINERQFGRRARVGAGSEAGHRFGPTEWIAPETTFSQKLALRVGETAFELRHTKGETDDHLWAWVPEHRALCVGDLMMWSFPNAGNPQKVQRYPLEWAEALRAMAGEEAELLLPAHGLPIGGAARVQQVLLDVAGALESLVEQSLALMNTGARLDTLLHEVRLPESVLGKPYLRPVYDEPEFIVRNIWRLYGGWYDGNPAHLKPAPEQALAVEVATLAGGAIALATRARDLAAKDEWRLACELIEWAAGAAPDDREIHGARAEIYAGRRQQELSLMARGIYGYAAEESKTIVDPESDG